MTKACAIRAFDAELRGSLTAAFANGIVSD